MISMLVLFVICCGCGGSRKITRNFRPHELVNYQTLKSKYCPK
ncbi:hypothetical protein LSH36_997g01020 [Paralvinella palmiformis]|uniref:Uncharacterized protein n=1 Tax=Paralvinella palmiformis TaxID=53620 RepID=A0AAD9IWV1_9ANNE|nr:hypothetical protein LSH36_997g01020 [Paralvinella palmiformis]